MMIASTKIRDRCAVIVELVQNMQPMYISESTSDYQRHHIETIIGAGIWYIPNKILWTGQISEAAIRNFHPEIGSEKPKLTEDHQYPRKVAAKALLEFDWTKVNNPRNSMTKMFVEKYGTYNLVTSKENRSLMKYQKVDVFSSPKRAYEQAGIALVNISNEQLLNVKRRDQQLIEELLNA